MEWIILVQVSNIIIGGYRGKCFWFIYQVRNEEGMLAHTDLFFFFSGGRQPYMNETYLEALLSQLIRGCDPRYPSRPVKDQVMSV